MHSQGTVKTMQQRCWFHAPNYKLCLFLKWPHMQCPLCQIGTFPLLSSVFTHPHSHPHDLFFLPKMPAPSCLTLGFLAFSWRWSNPSEQYWTSHSIQTSFLLYCFFFVFKSSPRYSVLSFPIFLRLHPVHSLSVEGLRIMELWIWSVKSN